MKNIKILIITSITLLIIMLVSCTVTTDNNEEKSCTSDLDCVAATCCHATDSVNINSRPDCQGVLCTASCEPNTMDCGQAKAKCIENICSVVKVEQD